jgi:hypothetical protein
MAEGHGFDFSATATNPSSQGAGRGSSPCWTHTAVRLRPRRPTSAVMAVIMAGKFSLPPSLSRTPSAQASGRKQEARQRAVITAMRSLPLIESAKPEGFVSAFEMTYYDVERKEREAAVPAATVEKQLNHMADKCSDLAKYLGKMHRDTIHEWSRAAGVVGPISIWQLSQILEHLWLSKQTSMRLFWKRFSRRME